MKRTSLYLVLSLFLVIAGAMAVTGCDESERYAIATGGSGGVYYPLGTAMSNILNDELEGVDISAESTGASVENVNLTANEDVHLALVQNDISYYAYEGIEMFDDEEPMEELRGMGTLYPETIQIVADAGEDIETVEDLDGKRVAVGAPGSGTEANARQLLNAHGITYDDIEADYLSFSEASDNLRDGHLDAAFVTAGTPTASITDLSTTHNIDLVSISEEMSEEIQEDYPYYAEVTIDEGTYSDDQEDVRALAVMAMIIVHEDLPEDIVYEMTKGIFTSTDELGEAHERGYEVTAEDALEGMSLELHLGAERFFDEQ
ncbi:TAXI family TRAP transporter solute-binding subunit [Natranaerobius trueperi]|uniref:C4-dicarboxylate ABC transporter substrate-binding protein n=1 Tax=Natranaerobius trueperi TaxID=759412 RepID=A0A226BXK8_9FIRM|nr:TAXI family TRAP transporter solute-binding subunit [Natranaerobius trueperi]OWZ83726.1 C4-dicarboxylate ABC transporter substrate-binding protein [Natranaerobius trueperi]